MQVSERLIGPPEVLGPIMGLSTKRPYAFRHPDGARDAGDFPSVRHIRALHRHSQKHGIGLTLEHLIYGATESQVADILASRQRQRLEAVG